MMRETLVRASTFLIVAALAACSGVQPVANDVIAEPDVVDPTPMPRAAKLAPKTLVSPGRAIVSMAVSDLYVYYTTPDEVRRYTLEGGEDVALAEKQFKPGSIATSGGDVFWADYAGGSVKMIASGSTDITVISDKLQRPLGLAVDDDAIFVSEHNEKTGKIWKFPRAGGEGAVLVEGQNLPKVATVDGQTLYWTNVVREAGGVYSVNIAGGAVTTIARNQMNPVNMAVGINSVFWVSGESVLSAQQTGGSKIVTVADGQVGANGVVYRSDAIYWTDGDGGALRARGSKEKVRTVAAGLGLPGQLVATDRGLYWADESPPKIQFLPYK